MSMKKKIFLYLLILFFISTWLIGCSNIESGFFIYNTQFDKNPIKVGDEVILTVEIAKKTGRQQIQHTAYMEVKVISNSEDIEVIPTPITEAEEVKENSLKVVARAGGVLPRPFKFTLKIKTTCKPGDYFLTITSTVNKEIDTKIIKFSVEGE